MSAHASAETGELAAARAAERAARESYGRLLAMLAARTRDIAAAEDALAAAFRLALERWPRAGVPRAPEAWLLTVARREAGRVARHERMRAGAAATLGALAAERAERPEPAFPDDRLRLMLACAHPAVASADHAPLMLQCVPGLDAARIGAAFLVGPAAMGQRLSRAKARLRTAGAAFEDPGPERLAEALSPALDAIYAALGAGWDVAPGADPRRHCLAEEALWLARVAAALAPDQPEALGLLALALHVAARQPARRAPDGAYAPLDAQDPALWRGDLAAEAEATLARAAALGAPGRFQIEAAIESAHLQRRREGGAEWRAVLALYDWLDRVAPSVGATVARAAALGMGGRPAEGLALLETLDAGRLAAHQPFFAARAHLRALTGDPSAAGDYARAIGLSDDPAIRAFLLAERAARGL